MFDEYDEGTAILPAVALKRNLPSGGEFIALDADGDLSLPSDWYLKIAGFAAEVMRDQRVVEKDLPRKMLLGDYWGSRKYGPAPSASGGSGSTAGSTATHVPNQKQAQAQQSTPSAPKVTGPVPKATIGFWQDIIDLKDELPPPAYTLEAEENASTPSATSAPSAASSTPQPPPSTAPTTRSDSHSRANTVHASSPSVTTQGPTEPERSSTCSPAPTTSSIQPAAPWTPPSSAPRFAPPPSAPPGPQAAAPHNFTPAIGPPTTPSHTSSPYNSAIATLSNEFSRMNTGSHGSTPSSPLPNAGNQTGLFPFNRPAETGQPQQQAHHTPPQPGHQTENTQSGTHGSPFLPTTGPQYSHPVWTPPTAPPTSPPPGAYSQPSQYPHSSSPAPQTQQWGLPSGPPPSTGSTVHLGAPSSTYSSPYPSPPSCPGANSLPQAVHGEHGSNTPIPFNTPWQSSQSSTPSCAGVQHQYPPTNQTGTLYGNQAQVGYHSGQTGTFYTPPPGPPHPPQHPSSGGASGWSGSGPQSDPNKRESCSTSRCPILIRFDTWY
jgi:hypothetical protein